MFGHHDDDESNKADDQIPAESIDGALAHGEAAVEQPAEPTIAPSSDDAASAPDLPAGDDQDWQHPGAPLPDPSDDSSSTGPISDIVSPAGGFPRSTDTQMSSHRPVPSGPVTSDDNDNDKDDDLVDPAINDLLEVKQHALADLAPLLSQLDQTPDEKFRTIMMMIQASDDQNLINAAYESAHGITDEKVRAQALLDIVNEINYFTQQHDS